MRRRVPPSLLLACALLGGSSCGADSSPARDASPAQQDAPTAAAQGAGSAPLANIVVVSIDTLRADHLGCYGYFRDTSPQLDALAAESILFERCLAPMATTLPSHVTLFTGTSPIEHGILANFVHGGRRYRPSEGMITLAMYLKGLGYDTAAFVSALPLKRRMGLDPGFDVYSNPSEPQRRAHETNWNVMTWLQQPRDRPFLLWVHYFDPHSTFDPPAPYDESFRAGDGVEEYIAARRIGELEERPTGQASESVESINLYDGEIRYTDEQLGKLLQTLRALPSWERTLVAVVGDHGEGLNQHGMPGHGQTWDEQLHVPFLIRAPGHTPRRVATTSAIADVVPTLLGLIELPGEAAFVAQMSGIDVLAQDDAERYVVGQSSGRQEEFDLERTWCLTGQRWKLVRHASGALELYDRARDPHELSDVSADHPDVLSRLSFALDNELEGQRTRARELGPERFLTDDVPDGPRKRKRADSDEEDLLTPEELEGLRALGYSGGDEDD